MDNLEKLTNKRQRIPNGQPQMDNLEKQTTQTLEDTEWAITNGQSREIDNIGHTRRRQTKQKHNTIYVGHHYSQANTNNVNKTRVLLQTTGRKDEPNIIFMRKLLKGYILLTETQATQCIVCFPSFKVEWDKMPRHRLFLKSVTDREKARTVDKVSRVVFPLVFAIFNIIYWVVYIVWHPEDRHTSQ